MTEYLGRATQAIDDTFAEGRDAVLDEMMVLIKAGAEADDPALKALADKVIAYTALIGKDAK